MKISILFILVPLMIASQAPAQGNKNDSMTIKKVWNEGSRSEITINVSGANLFKKNRHKKAYERSIGTFEFGFNGLVSANYDMYNSNEEGFLGLNNGRSMSVGINVLHMEGNINRSHSLGWSAALGIVWRDYVFSENITLSRVDGMIQPVEIEKKYKKSKLNTFAFHIPVVFEANYNDYFIAAGVYGDLIMGSHTKIKFPKQKSHDMYVQTFQAGVTARVGCKRVYVFGNYGLVSMFKKDKGPRTKPVTFGFGVGF